MSTLGPDEMRLASPIQSDSIVDGEGLRAVVWAQGCRRFCPGCHNPESWDLNKGDIVKVDWVIEQLSKLRGQSGVTFSGGEPFLQPLAYKKIADWARREKGWTVWSFSGYTYEQLKAEGGDKWELVKSLDALIDGPFVLGLRDISLRFRGSKNQRLIHLQGGEIVKIE